MIGLAVLLSALAPAACGGDGSAEDGPNSLREIIESQFDSQDFMQQQEAIRDCMVAQGFEYTPTDMRGANIQRRERDFSDEEWVRENGFGITTGFDRLQDEVPIDGGGEDPNMTYRNSLSPQQQEAYDRALFGEAETDDGEPGFKFGTGDEPAGCFGEAIAANDPAFFKTEWADALGELQQQIESDQRIIDANRDWSECMANEGFTYASREDAIDDIQGRFNDILGLEAPEDGPGGGSVRIEIRPGEDPKATYDQAAMAELREEELRVAMASFECGKDTIDEVEPDVREEYEQQSSTTTPN